MLKLLNESVNLLNKLSERPDISKPQTRGCFQCLKLFFKLFVL